MGTKSKIEVGTIVEGKVSGVTKFGAFVDLPDGTTGMVHISEIASSYVNEIGDFVKIGDIVKVKVLPTDTGKIALSIKQAMPKNDEDIKRPQKPRNRKPYKPSEPVTRPGDYVWQPTLNNSGSFEDMMSKFKQTSEDKMSDLNRANGESRGYSRRGGSRR